MVVPELVRTLSGLLDVVMALEPEGVACVALAAAARAARFCMAFSPEIHSRVELRHTHSLNLSLREDEVRERLVCEFVRVSVRLYVYGLASMYMCVHASMCEYVCVPVMGCRLLRAFPEEADCWRSCK